MSLLLVEVADDRPNRNGRTYPRKVLESIARQANLDPLTIPVFAERDDCTVERPNIRGLVGRVVEMRVDDMPAPGGGTRCVLLARVEMHSDPPGSAIGALDGEGRVEKGGSVRRFDLKRLWLLPRRQP